MLMRGLRIKGGKSRRGKLSLICKAGVRNSELSRQHCKVDKTRSGGEGKLTGTVSVKLEKPSAAKVQEGLTGTNWHPTWESGLRSSGGDFTGSHPGLAHYLPLSGRQLKTDAQDSGFNVKRPQMQHTLVWHRRARKRSSKNGRGQDKTACPFPSIQVRAEPRGREAPSGRAEAARALPGGRARRRGPQASARPRAAPVAGTARSLPAAALTCPGPGRA